MDPQTLAAPPLADEDSERLGPKPLALVADDSTSMRELVAMIARSNGYETTLAIDGRDALEKFRQRRPELVLMGVMMPRMNGYLSASEMRKLCGEAFVPILLMTSSNDPAIIARCVSAGADDIIPKPFNPTLLKSKLTAMERIRELHRTMHDLYEQMRADELVAEQVFTQAVVARNAKLPRLQTFLKGLRTFSGDVLLTEFTPSGELNLLLGDFTGHGLAAALGALPAGDTFRAMTKKGFTPEQILEGINQKLCHLLPTGMFMAVQFIQVSPQLNQIRLINHGMPDLLVIDGRSHRIRTRVPSAGMPLGVIEHLDVGSSSRKYDFLPGDRVLAYSDGVTETRGQGGGIFGEDRLLQSIENAGSGSVIDTVVDSLEQFRGDAPQSDDISLVEIPNDPELFGPSISEARPAQPLINESSPNLVSDWEFSVLLRPASLRHADILPRLFGHIRDFMRRESDRKAVFSVISELFNNALDHGVLGLDSAAKAGSDGFAAYYRERERRLSELSSGWIRFEVAIRCNPDHGVLNLLIEDSGEGFDLARIPLFPPSGAQFSGHGLRLVRELTGSLEIDPPGNRVRASYFW